MGCNNSKTNKNASRGFTDKNGPGEAYLSRSQGSEVEDKLLEKESDDKVIFRWLRIDDYSKGFPAVLAGLT